MTLFALLVSLSLERLFKMGDHWRISRLFTLAFKRMLPPSRRATAVLTAVWLAVLIVIYCALDNILFNLPLLVFSIVMGWLCFGAGITRRHYRQYLKAASEGDDQAMAAMAEELSFIHGLPNGDMTAQLKELQNALIWINYRYYLAPIIIFVSFAKFGVIALAVYALLRSYQTWLARNVDPQLRLQSGVDQILHWLDWIPIRIVALAYAVLGDGTKAFPALKEAITDGKTSQYQILTQLAQLSLADQPQDDVVKTPIAAVTLAKKVSTAVIVIVSILTIYGTII
jgi:AmpE protein